MESWSFLASDANNKNNKNNQQIQVSNALATTGEEIPRVDTPTGTPMLEQIVVSTVSQPSPNSVGNSNSRVIRQYDMPFGFGSPVALGTGML